MVTSDSTQIDIFIDADLFFTADINTLLQLLQSYSTEKINIQARISQTTLNNILRNKSSDETKEINDLICNNPIEMITVQNMESSERDKRDAYIEQLEIHSRDRSLSLSMCDSLVECAYALTKNQPWCGSIWIITNKEEDFSPLFPSNNLEQILRINSNYLRVTSLENLRTFLSEHFVINQQAESTEQAPSVTVPQNSEEPQRGQEPIGSTSEEQGPYKTIDELITKAFLFDD